MRGIRLGFSMAEVVLSFIDAQHRHLLAAPRWNKPWAKRLGPGVVGLHLDLHAGSVLGLGPKRGWKDHASSHDGRHTTASERPSGGSFSIKSGVEVDDLRKWVGHMPEQVRWQGRITVNNMLLQLAEMRHEGQDRLTGCSNWWASPLGKTRC